MPDQFVVVRIKRDGRNLGAKRKVLIDGQESGRTNEMLRVGEGTHTIRLLDPTGFVPSFRRPTVTGTNVIQPMEVTFDEE